MQRLLNCADMKKCEATADKNGISYLELMINAGTNAGIFLKKVAEQNNFKTILFLAGKGNNGGDCSVAAEYLKKNTDMQICICFPLGEAVTEISKKTQYSAEKSGVEIVETPPENVDILVDGIFGTGFHGELSTEVVEILSKCKSKLKVAFDIPSGGNGTDGTADENTLFFDYTITFGTLKTGLYQYPLFEHCGKIVVAEIGFTEETYKVVEENWNICSEEDIKSFIPQREENSNKGTFGKLLCITGSENMPGACCMSTLSAVKAGVGLVYCATAEKNIPIVVQNNFSPVFVGLESDEQGHILFNENNKIKIENYLEKATAVLIGCGLGIAEDTKKLCEYVIENANCPVVADADALNIISLSNKKEKLLNKKNLIITPHPMEMSRLSGISVSEIQSSRISFSEEWSEKYPELVTVLKGSFSTINCGKNHYINTTGNSGMAKAGSGDVLAGIISSLVAQGITAEKSAVSGVYIHGKAGDFAAEKHSKHAMTPENIISSMEEVFLNIEN